MLAQQVGKKYGMALFQLVRDKNLIDEAWEQFDDLAAYLKKDEAFFDFMAAPQIPDRDKEQLVRRIFESRFDKTLLNFLMVLTEKRRINYLIEIIEEFDRLVRAEKGIEIATCITAVPLTERERQGLVGRLAAKTNLKIELDEKIDESIIGGMIVILQNQIIDGSIRHSLQVLRNRLMGLKVH
jgi:F-type H+-transporting ATPase subunit delta